jgi:hypothetical protein
MESKNSTTKTCIIKNCSNKAKIRGLCQRCYSVAVDLVKTKQTTWETLVSIGLAQESDRKKPQPFTVAFKEAMKITHTDYEK